MAEWKPVKASRILEAAQLAGWEVEDWGYLLMLSRGSIQVQFPFLPTQELSAYQVEHYAKSLWLRPEDS